MTNNKSYFSNNVILNVEYKLRTYIFSATKTTDWMALLFVLSLWFLLRPYAGFYHDGVLYAFQAVTFNNPDMASNDLMSMFISQGALTLFTPINTLIVSAMGVEKAAFFLYVLSQVAWFFAIYLLGKALLTYSQLALLITLVFAFSKGVYLVNVFSVNESFLTSRILAEALALYALYFVVVDRQKLFILFCCLSTWIHPLIGVWAVLIALGLWCLSKIGKKYFIYLYLTLIIILAGAFFVFSEPSAYLTELQRADRVMYGFVSNWGNAAYIKISTYLVILLAFLRLAETSILKDLTFLMLLVGFSALLFSSLGDWLNSQLLITLQFWRVFWLIHVYSLLAACIIFFKSWKEGRWLLLSLLLGVFWLEQTWLKGLFLILLLSVVLIREKSLLKKAATHLYSICFSVGVILLVFIQELISFLLWFEVDAELSILFSGRNHTVFIIFLISSLLLLTKDKVIKFMCVILSSLSIIYFVNTSNLHSYQLPPKVYSYLDSKIAANEVVYWDSMELEVWFGLNRAFYYSPIQLTPSLYSQELFREGRRRQEVIKLANDKDSTAKKNNILCADNTLDWIINSVDMNSDQYDFVYESKRFSLMSCI